MKQIIRVFLYCLVLVSAFSSCQKTNVSDLITYRRIQDERVQDYQKTVTLTSSRDALILDSLDYTGDKLTLRKGTTLKVLGLRGDVGSFKAIPVIFCKKRMEVDVWLAELSDGRRVYVQVPEIHSLPEVLTSNNTAIYFPHRHPKPIYSDINGSDSTKVWEKCLYHLSNTYNLSATHNLSTILYKDASFYLYKPLIKGLPRWIKLVVQAVLSFLLLIVIFMGLVPWLSLNAIWHIRFLPNWLVKILCAVLCYILAFFIGGFLGVTAIGFVVWALMLVSRYFPSIFSDVDWERCPHCHRLGIHYKGTDYGKWNRSRREWDKEEVKDITHREHDESNGIGITRVKETIYHKGIKHYIGITDYRSVVNNFVCPHCHMEINLHSSEDKYHESSDWK